MSGSEQNDLNRRQFAALGAAAAAAAWPIAAAAAPAAPPLYPGEELASAAGYPALVRFEAGRRDLPLVVFVTGGGVLARVAYGPPSGRPEDFLCYWLHEAGFSSLALSYPIDLGSVFETTFPQFSMTDWAEQSAALIARFVDANDLDANVIVLGWSMAGRIAEPLNAALKRRGKGIALFVSMAGATALPDMLPGLDSLQPAPSGLAAIKGVYLDWLVQLLADQNRSAGHVVLDVDSFAADMAGDFPIALAASAMRLRNGTFVADAAADARDVGASQYSSFPPLALMTHASPIDARHALTDHAAWGFFITQQLCETHIFARASALTAMPPAKWTRLVQHVSEAGGQMSVTLPGNHMFFIGEDGAKRTVAALKQLRQSAAVIAAEMAQLIT